MSSEDLIQHIAQQALERSAGFENRKITLRELVENFEQRWASAPGIPSLISSLDKIRGMMADYQPALWAALLHQAIEGGRNSVDARRYVMTALYGWGIAQSGDDSELVSRARKALEMMEQHEVVDEDQLAITTARWLNAYARRRPDRAVALAQEMSALFEAEEVGDAPHKGTSP